MATILFYSPVNQRSRDIESLMLGFKDQGHKVISLSQAAGKNIHPFLMANGIETAEYICLHKNRLRFHLSHLLYFIRFNFSRKVDIVYSHLEPANFISAIGQFLVRANVFICRHHIDEAYLYGFDRSFSYRLTYKLAKKIIVVSRQAKQYMIEKEGIPPHKIIPINLGYDFRLYPIVEERRVKEIRQAYNVEILLVTVCRLTKFKRPDLAIMVAKRLKEKGIRTKLIILGKGEMKEDLESKVKDLELQDTILFLGHVDNVLDYLASADFLLHPSLLESSCITVKEAGIVKLPVIVCGGVGDFSEYVHYAVNGFLVAKEEFVDQSSLIIEKYYQQRAQLLEIGNALSRTIYSNFSIEKVLPHYADLNSI